MYTQCVRCKKLFFGHASAFNLRAEPYCAGCFNSIAYGNPLKDSVGTVTPNDIPLFTDNPMDVPGLSDWNDSHPPSVV